MSRWSLAGAWIVVAVLATTLTWQIVSAADAQVSDRPAPLQVGAPLLAASDSTTTSTATGSTGTSQTGTSTSTTVTTVAGSSSSTNPESTSSSTSSSSTSVAAALLVRTIPTGGGVVVVSYQPGEVALSSATPGPGFAAEIKRSGPPDVDVEFESETAKFRVKAEWSNGALSVEADANVSGQSD